MTNDNMMKTDLMRYRESIEDLVDERIVTDLLRVVKKGKEAVVVCCAAHPQMPCEYIALKLYRERRFRNFRRDNIYHEGRVWDRRLLRAIASNTQVGFKVERAVWVGAEYDALDVLYSAGVAVPQPFACTEDAVAMQFIGEGEQAAPLLKNVRFETPAQARACFDAILDALQTMLRHHVVHGDLSPFNILYHRQQPCIIDFPQCVDPATNANAWALFLRDVEHMIEHFSRYGLEYDAHELACSLWEPVYGPVQHEQLLMEC